MHFLYKFERISVVVAVVVVVWWSSSFLTRRRLYSSTRIMLFFMVPDVWLFAPDMLFFSFVNVAPPPTWAASAGPENHNSEVYRDTINISARRDGECFRIKSAVRGKDGLN